MPTKSGMPMGLMSRYLSLAVLPNSSTVCAKGEREMLADAQKQKGGAFRLNWSRPETCKSPKAAGNLYFVSHNKGHSIG